VRIENDCIAVELDTATGGFASLYDKRRDSEYVIAPDRALLFRLMMPDGELAHVHVDSADPEIAVCGATATLTYRLPGVAATVTLTLDGDAILAGLSLTNTGEANIEEIMFPMLRGIGPIPGGQIVAPNFWKRRYDDPFGKDLGGDHRTWNDWTQKFHSRYPAYMASAWLDYGDQNRGLAIEGRHTDFSMMDFFVHKVLEKERDPVRRTLDIAIVHPRRVKPGESHVSSPVRIVLHEGDWHAVADEHRTWLDTWIGKPDRPARFAESIGWHFFFMKHQDGLECHTYADLPKLARAALEAGCPYLLLFGWQTGGHDNNYFYRYVPNEDWGGADALRRAVGECRAMGVEIMPFFNGTLANIEMPEHKEFGHRWEARTRAGHPYYAGDWARHNFDAPSRNRAMLHTEVAFCAEHRKYFLETVKRIVQDYGFGNTQLDQMAEKMLVDYCEDHIVTTPDRVYVDGVNELLPGVRRIVREANPDGVMISEAINEFTGQWCDSSWDWTVLLPFPEPILYTLPWLMASHEIDALEFGETNHAFAYKMHLDMKIDGGDAPITKYPAFAEHVKGLAELRRRTADYSVHADFRDQENVKVQGPETAFVKVYHNKAARKTGIVVAETAGRSCRVALEIGWKARNGTIAIDTNRGDCASIRQAEVVEVELVPYEVRILCMDLA